MRCRSKGPPDRPVAYDKPLGWQADCDCDRSRRADVRRRKFSPAAQLFTRLAPASLLTGRLARL